MNDIRLFAKITKVDKEQRTVEGVASSETVDKQNEIVDYNASKVAFGEWNGAIREMHQPISVGKAVEIIPDDENKCVYVKAFISRGAEDTWTKIKEGVLTGFSIGGNTLDKSVQIIKDAKSGQEKHVTRINKYRLNELSLVDNPANPDAEFTLVKRADDGTLYQTNVVEDIQKIIKSDSDELLEAEIKEYREKADGLARKVLTTDDLDKLIDEDFGVVRKHFSPQGKEIKERLLPMPDKVHAHTVIRKLESYPLSDEERELVHAKAKNMLGTSHKEEECKVCKTTTVEKTGGNIDDMDTQIAKELTGKIDALVEQIGKMLKQYEAGRITEKANPAISDLKTQDEQPVPAEKAVGESTTEKANPATSDLKTQDEQPVPAKKDVGVSTTEKADPATSDLKTQDEQPVPAKKAADATEKAADPATSSLKTQDEQPVPAKKAIGAEVVPAEEEDEEAELVAEKTTKSANSSDIQKLVSKVETLQKAFDALKKEPLPRKMYSRVEKSYDNEPENIEKQIEDVRAEIKKYTSTGREVPTELRQKGTELVNKSLGIKFGGSNTQKVS